VYQWVGHCVEKFGRQEVEQWYWETWNEANTGYWRAHRRNFTNSTIMRLTPCDGRCPRRVWAAPDAAGGGGQWLRNFLEHCLHGTNYATGKIGTPLDFVAFSCQRRSNLR